MELLEVNTELNKENRTSWQPNIYFLRQLLISSAAWTCYFLIGLSFGASTVFIPQIRAEANSTEAVTEEVASWIPSINVYSGLPWSFILPISMKIFGRKYTLMFVCISNLVSYILLYVSANVTQIVICQFVNGINSGGHFTVSVIIITEYTTPKYRGFFLTAKSATLFWGILVSNAIGTFFHWKNIAIVGMACSIYSIIIAIILPESPYWLTTKHSFVECSKVHRWLKGDDIKSEKALEQSINFQMVIDRRAKETKSNLRNMLLINFKNLSSKLFYKPLLLSILIQSLYIFSGKVVISVYALDIIRKITKDQQISAYTTMIILDTVTIIFMYIGCALSRIFPRRKLLLSTSFVSILFLLALSVYTFMIKSKYAVENNYVAMSLMVGYSIAISFGPIILPQAISGELVSLDSRALSSCCIDVCVKIILGTVVKLSPYAFNAWGTDGAFLLFSVSSSLLLVLVYKYLPETKDKTLQEIAETMQGPNKQKSLKEESELMSDDCK